MKLSFILKYAFIESYTFMHSFHYWYSLSSRTLCLMSNTIAHYNHQWLTHLLDMTNSGFVVSYHILSEQCFANTVVKVVLWNYFILVGMGFLLNQEILQWQEKEQKKLRNENRCPSEINDGVSSLMKVLSVLEREIMIFSVQYWNSQMNRKCGSLYGKISE